MAVMQRVAPLALALAAGLALAACGPGGGLGKALLQQVRAGSAEGVPISSIPRAQIEAAGVPITRVTLPERGIDLLMFERDRRDDIVTFATADGSTYTFRNGILIETRGLGQDLMSSAAPTLGVLRRGEGHTRTRFVIGPDDRTLREDFACQSTDGGAETVVIQGKSSAVRRIDEVCEGAAGRITNTYWLQGDVVRKSREWVSESAGHAQFERITD